MWLKSNIKQKWGVYMLGKDLNLQRISREPIIEVLNRFVDGYIAHKEGLLGSFIMKEEVEYLISALDKEKEIHIKSSESLDKVSEILRDVLKGENVSQEERKDIYRVLEQISNIHKEGQLQKTRHTTSRVIAAMGIVGSVAISLGSILIHEKYKTQREREKWNNYLNRR